MSTCIGYDVSASGLRAGSHWESSFLLFSNNDYAKQAVNAVVALNYATFVAHKTIFKSRTSPTTVQQAVAAILKIALSIYANLRLDKWAPIQPVRGVILEISNHARCSTFGSAGKRTPLQQRQAKQKAYLDIKATEPNAAVMFTDGSTHMSNPGPCGAGVVLYMPQHRGQLHALHEPLPLSETDWDRHNASPAHHGGAPPPRSLPSNPPSSLPLSNSVPNVVEV